MNKGLKTFALVGLAACAIGAASALTACDNREKLTIWRAQEVGDLTDMQVNRFVSQYEDFPYKLKFEDVSEGDAVTNVLNDVTAAGDIFFFAQDQLARVVQSGALSAVPSSYLSDVVARNDTTSVKAATAGDTVYVYPVTSDNGFFAYYDTTILSETDMATQEGMIAAINEYNSNNDADAFIAFNIAGSGWYNAAYFFGTGAVSEWETDSDGNFTNYYDTYNSLNGYDALEGMAQLMASGLFADKNDAQQFASGAAVVVSGTWDSSTAKQLLGDHDGYAATKLWTVTIPKTTRDQYITDGVTDPAPEEELSEGARTYQLGSFSGCKLLGVRRNEDGEKNAWSHAIADYLTNEECQLERFESNGWGPSNIYAQQDEGVLSDEALAALNAQNEFATPQGNYPGSWWDNTITVGTTVQQANSTVLTAAQCESILEAYDAGNRAVLSASDYAYALVGELSETGGTWQTMPASYASTAAKYALSDSNAEAGTYSVSGGVKHGKWIIDDVNIVTSTNQLDGEDVGLFRFVDYGDWTGNYGYTHLATGSLGAYWVDDNNIALPAGSYTVVFDYTDTTPVITITANE